jgi:DNA polymerase-3 subunit delta'
VADVAALLVRRDGIDPDLALTAARAAQSHIGIARRLATDAGARERRDATVRLPLTLRDVTTAVQAAASLLELAQAEAGSSNEERDAVEKAALLRNLGAPETGPLPPSLRSQVRALEEDQKRRAKRSVTDHLDRALTDLLSFYRDVLVLQLDARASTGVENSSLELVNEPLRAALLDFAARARPEATLERMDAVNAARRRLTSTNVAPLLALEAMAVSLL